MILRYILILILIFNFIFQLSGQVDRVFTLSEYLSIVRDNHPVFYQANILNNKVDAIQRIARGGFDPKIEGDWDHKSFDGKNYYSLANGQLKIPTWYGIELKAGYDRNQGVFLNQSDQLPLRGLWNAGISVPLGKGLVIDERRAELQRADIYQRANKVEQQMLINQLTFDALDTYLQWQAAYNLRDIAIEGLTLASQRLTGTVSSFINGDKPAIDTLESYISLQVRQLELAKAEQILENSRLAINNFLWQEGEIPLELDSASIPETLDITLLQSKVDSLSIMQDEILLTHPEVLLYEYKIDDLKVKNRLAREELKPDIRVTYNPLISSTQDALIGSFNANDYKVGASVYYPIFLRKERGKLQLNKLEIEENTYSQKLKRQEVNIKLNTYLNNIDQTQRQFFIAEETINNYRLMLSAENKKFEIGESSIFLINSREIKYLESRYKQVENAQKLIYNKIKYLLFTGEIFTITL